jgi:D-tyrosyl-tRNA(Tyr) deacylase
MRTVVQRVAEGAVEVDGSTVGAIGQGFVVLVGVEPTDTVDDADACAGKIVGLRVFRDDEGKMNRSLTDVGGAVLVISQFTLAGDVRKGRRPSFIGAARPDLAEPLVSRFCDVIADAGVLVERGVFGADMRVTIVNDGPVTLLVDSCEGVIL